MMPPSRGPLLLPLRPEPVPREMQTRSPGEGWGSPAQPWGPPPLAFWLIPGKGLRRSTSSRQNAFPGPLGRNSYVALLLEKGKPQPPFAPHCPVVLHLLAHGHCLSQTPWVLMPRVPQLLPPRPAPSEPLPPMDLFGRATALLTRQRCPVLKDGTHPHPLLPLPPLGGGS